MSGVGDDNHGAEPVDLGFGWSQLPTRGQVRQALLRPPRTGPAAIQDVAEGLAGLWRRAGCATVSRNFVKIMLQGLYMVSGQGGEGAMDDQLFDIALPEDKRTKEDDFDAEFYADQNGPRQRKVQDTAAWNRKPKLSVKKEVEEAPVSVDTANFVSAHDATGTRNNTRALWIAADTALDPLSADIKPFQFIKTDPPSASGDTSSRSISPAGFYLPPYCLTESASEPAPDQASASDQASALDQASATDETCSLRARLNQELAFRREVEADVLKIYQVALEHDSQIPDVLVHLETLVKKFESGSSEELPVDQSEVRKPLWSDAEDSSSDDQAEDDFFGPSSSIVVCPDCQMHFNRLDCLQTHLAEKSCFPQESKKALCQICFHMVLPEDMDEHSDEHRRHLLQDTAAAAGGNCPFCKERVVPFSGINEHIRLRHDVRLSGRICCVVCRDTLESSRAARQHWNRCHAPRGSSGYCHRCRLVLRNGRQLKGHVCTSNYSHGSSYYSERDAKRSNRSSDNDRSEVKGEAKLCPVCYLRVDVTKFPSHEEEHKSSLNLADSKPCPLCQIEISPYNQINIHLQESHLTKARSPLLCLACDKMCNNSKAELARHWMRHHKTTTNATTSHASFLCPTCGLELKSSRHLKTHICPMVQRVKDKTCDQCGKSFYTAEMLRRHLREMHSGQSYHCQQCSKVFTSKRLYVKHSLTHVKIRPFQCTVCDWRSHLKHSVTNHVKLMHNQKIKVSQVRIVADEMQRYREFFKNKRSKLNAGAEEEEDPT